MQDEAIDYLALSEMTKARTDIEFGYDGLVARSEHLIDEVLRGLARNFGMDDFPE